MIYSTEVQNMCPVAKGAYHGPAPIPEEGKWVQAKEIKDISGFTHGVGWCAPQQGACKLTLNVKEGVIQEALVETLGCSGMTHSAAMASEILIGKTILEAVERKSTLKDTLVHMVSEAVEDDVCPVCGGHHGHEQNRRGRDAPRYARALRQPQQPPPEGPGGQPGPHGGPGDHCQMPQR